MDDDVFRDHDTAQDDLAGFIHGLDLVLRDLGRIIAVERMIRNDDRLQVILCHFGGNHCNILHGCDIGQDFHTGYGDRLVTGRGYVQGIF